ncbi:MAG: S-layer homology domain-containing protein, partial [Candidatus Margulisbacteria bacterium]|nr:S-layer homology domain-containing protein [Candidatus Margulisiibacteriota bacterium]
LKRLFSFLAACLLILACYAGPTSALGKVSNNDLAQINVGARVLGMGKAFVGLADDINSIYINPAGLSQIKNWQVTSMTSKFINEIDYMNVGGVYPTNFGVFGVGFLGGSLGYTTASTTIESVDGDIRYVASSTEVTSHNYKNNTLLLSYSVPLTMVYEHRYLKDISAGANLKVFSEVLAGTGIVGGSAVGYDMDLALQYKPLGPVNAGVVLQDIIPASMGGKIVWANGVEEAVPSVMKTGLSLKILGDNALRRLGSQVLTMSLDNDLSLTRGYLPSLFHLGFEWSPVEAIDLRLGLDQDHVGAGDGSVGVASNLTAGVGLYYNGYRFDYAYHQYYDVPQLDTHYFSLAYGIWKHPPVKEILLVISPKDKTIAYSSTIRVFGQIMDPYIRDAKVSAVALKADEKGYFESDALLTVKKNPILIEAIKGGKTVETSKIRVLRLLTFKDIEPTYWAKLPIEQLATLDMINGYPDGNFRPHQSVSRAEYATLLVKMLGVTVEAVSKPPFKDVPVKHWAAPYIAIAAKMGLVAGYPDGTFKPSQKINRVEGVVMAVRFGKIEELIIAAKGSVEGPFPDISARHWASAEIQAARTAGYLNYLEGKPFMPRQELPRGETAEILSHTKFVASKIFELMDWETGY